MDSKLIFDDDTVIGYAGDITGWLAEQIETLSNKLLVDIDLIDELCEFTNLCKDVATNYDERAILKIFPSLMGTYTIKILDE
ncbi:MAG: hypothetical protein IKE23_00160 [Exiguobacterium sp.]|nr:hypothetical protein [Exiguobacterium sp.]